jgi:hypothetical protein
MLALLLLAAGLMACSAPDQTSFEQATPSPTQAAISSSPSVSTSPEPSETPGAQGSPVPSELEGTWEAEIVPRVGGFAPTATLTLTGTSFHLVRDPDIASGTVAAEGDEIEFSPGSVCQVPGTYRWSLEDGTLTFTVVSDSCPGRLAMLDGQEYRR